MKINKRPLFALLCILTLLVTLSVSVFADEETEIQTDNPMVPLETTTEDAEIIETWTPEGNLTLVDDTTETDEGDKQFITMVSKNGNYFYLVIDRTGNSDNVYFLNMVDESDLLALLEDAPETAVCICSDHCEVGAVNTDCPVCATDMSQCQGIVPEVVTPTVEPEVEHTTATNTNTLMVSVVIMVLALGGGAYYFIVMRKKKSNKPTQAEEYYDDEEY